MKVLAINSSARIGGQSKTELMLNHLVEDKCYFSIKNEKFEADLGTVDLPRSSGRWYWDESCPETSYGHLCSMISSIAGSMFLRPDRVSFPRLRMVASGLSSMMPSTGLTTVP